MAVAERSADVVWTGDLASGKGIVTVRSGAFPAFPVTWFSRTERSDGMTSPEELIAAAHASCFSMALAHELAQADTPPDRLRVGAKATLDKTQAGLRITTIELEVWGNVPGSDATKFAQAAEAAKKGCPVSNALTGVDIRLTAYFEEQ